MSDPETRQLNTEIDAALHTEVRLFSVKNNTPIRKMVSEALRAYMDDEEREKEKEIPIG